MASDNSFMHLIRPNVLAPAAGSANGPAKIKIHTPAILTILEIISKQILGKRIIGSLLGIRSDDGLEIEIKDAFMVPINETGDSIIIEDQAHKLLYQLYKKSHPKETVLGWFASMKEIDDTTSLIHDFYSKGTDRCFPHPAIFLNIQYLNEKNEIITPTFKTYIGAAVGKPQTKSNVQIGWNKTTNVNNSYIFTPIPNFIINGTITEKIAYNQLLQNSIINNTNRDQEQQSSNNNTSSSSSSLSVSTSSSTSSSFSSSSNQLSFLSQNLQQVQKNVENLITYINNLSTTDKNSNKNLNLLRQLINNLINKPEILINTEILNKNFENYNQDIIMIEYLTKALKDQIELSARLTAKAESEKRY
ncbi:uncharacterized protein KGF55_005768 [Candida pseudojiufengensis]|uniref:uncharacterized protein n=1 Tax=Candida pseudojiufengensis TaxID=497109 RepID=UPI0022249C2B|nr:uncharacterized protein KGF55_005768 [Candida pseudojiufengensis]KAI5958508.1 hypothetical protein KGF55_005768 [Candida pseudojiufengensis]